MLGVLEAPEKASYADRSWAVGFLGLDGATKQGLVGGDLAAERDALLARGRIGAALRVERDIAVAPPSPATRALEAFAAAHLPAPPGAEETAASLEAGAVTVGPATCGVTSHVETRTVTHTETVPGRATSPSEKDRLYALERSIGQLELELQRMGEPELVTDYAVDRDGTVRSGLVPKDDPRRESVLERLNALRAERASLVESSAPVLPSERTVTEQVRGDAYEQVICTADAGQVGSLVFGGGRESLSRHARGTASARRRPGDAAARDEQARLAVQMAGRSLEEAEWEGLAEAMDALTRSAIDAALAEVAAAHGWTADELAEERRLLVERFAARAEAP
ncbi:MAG: hypothetical protein H6737_02495 [Alphaproteobacteria bacterium]|nr:hypothetical protein [Alphaproteobacteria bacterium]